MTDYRRPLCRACGTRSVERRYGIGTDQTWRTRCRPCRDAGAPLNDVYDPRAVGVCSRCGFVAEDICQLDVDHQDGDRLNNHPDNLVILCANCHRLKSKQAGDHRRQYPAQLPPVRPRPGRRPAGAA